MLSLLKRIYQSISFLPSLLAVFFGLFAIFLILFPHLGNGVEFLDYLRVRHTTNIQFILAFVIGGVFTLTVFSYTMVMNVLNRSINNYSPRIVPLLLSQKNHQFILGVSSGTLIYAIMLSLFVGTDHPTGFPSLGAFFAIFFAMLCVILFIYFIHGVSQSIHINHILARAYHNVSNNLSTFLGLKENLKNKDCETMPHSYSLLKCGYFHKFEIKKLGRIAEKHKVNIHITKKMGAFVLVGEPIFSTSRAIDKKLEKKIARCLSIDKSEAMDVPVVGFKHLVEVALKACSPALNDPATALSAIDYLTQLLVKRAQLKAFNAYFSSETHGLYFSLVSLKDFVDYAYAEMYVYMKDDPIMVKKLEQSLHKVREVSAVTLPPNAVIFKKGTTVDLDPGSEG